MFERSTRMLVIYSTLLTLYLRGTAAQGGRCKFGVGCANQCHCQNAAVCKNVTGECPNDLCDQGWTGKNCSIGCVGRYGTNCQKECHCLPSVACNPVNGNCQEGCHPDWGGPSCSIQLPKLLQHPEVTDAGCGNATVRWAEWDGNDVSTSAGSGPVLYYRLMYQINDTWSQFGREVYHKNGSIVHTVVLSDLSEGSHRFRVDTFRRKEPGSTRVFLGPPGIPTEEIDLTCPDPTTVKPVPPTQRPVHRYFEKIIVENITENNAIISWTLAQNVTYFVTNWTISYEWLPPVNCPSRVNSVEIDPDIDTSFELRDLEAGASYRVTLKLTLDNSTEVEKVTSFATLTAEPSVVISGVRVPTITAHSIVVVWHAPGCEGLGGEFRRYDVKVRRVGEGGTAKVLASPTEMAEIKRLEPYTTYNISVRYVNEAGAGNFSREITERTAQGVPGVPTNVVLTSTKTSIMATWSLPDVTHGVIQEYRVAYWTEDHNSTNEPKLVMESDDRYIVLEKLTPATVYIVKISARTKADWGNETEDKVSTKPPRQGPPTRLRSIQSNESCVALEWSLPVSVYSAALYYVIEYNIEDTFSSPPVDKSVKQSNISAKATSATICRLQYSTMYRFTVAMVTDNGIGHPDVANVWTEIASPSQPDRFNIVETTNSTMTVSIHRVTALRGPLLYYWVVVSEVTGRRRRGVRLPGYTSAELSSGFVAGNDQFVVGDGRTYNRYKNGALKVDTAYEISFVVLTRHRNVTKSAHATVRGRTAPNEPVVLATSNTLVIILVILFVVVLVIVAGVLVYCYRRQTTRKEVYASFSNKTPESSIVQQAEVDFEKYWSKTSTLSDTRHIIAGRNYLPSEKTGILAYHPPRSDVFAPISFHKEFYSLPHNKKTANVAKQPENKSRNRFDHLLPYDQTRVTLRVDENSNNSYINASYIDGVRRKHAYIAAQSPFNHDTVLDFWRLIYQREISVMVIISKLEEEEIIRCTQFWPDDDNVRTYANFVMKVEQTDTYANFVIRRISITGRSEKSVQTLTVLHYKSWPEHGVPDDPYPFIQFRDKVRTYMTAHDTVLVHCGTGVGRTAVYITVDALIDQYQATGEVSVFQFVKKMRGNRIGMVRTFRQYLFIYKTLFECFCGGKTRMTADMKVAYRSLREKNVVTRRSYLKDQFISLREFTPEISKSDCRGSMLNASKCRYQDVIPADKFRPVINTLGGVERNDYINAVLVDGYTRTNAFVLTQTPLSSTVIDFWKLVHDYNVTSIVMMEDVFESANGEVQYWPDDRCSAVIEPYVVDSISDPEVYCSGETKEEIVSVRTFHLHNKQRPRASPREVKQFHFKAWTGTRFVPESKAQFLDMMEVVNDWQGGSCGNAAPVLVHCADGATQSGLYCALSVLCETMQLEEEADIYHIVKSMKRRRPQIIDQLEQYRFLYKVLWDFINLRMSHGLGHDNDGFSASSPSLYSTLFNDQDDDSGADPEEQFTFDLYSQANDDLNGHVVGLYPHSSRDV